MRCITRVVIDNRCYGIRQTTVDTSTMTPLFKDNTAFFLNVLWVYLDAMAPVTKYPKHLFIELCILCWDVMNGITCVINARERLKIIEIMTAKEVHHTVREVIRGIKSQVFEHVGKPHLVLILHDSTHILVEIILCLTNIRAVIVDVISQAIG